MKFKLLALLLAGVLPACAEAGVFAVHNEASRQSATQAQAAEVPDIPAYALKPSSKGAGQDISLQEDDQELMPVSGAGKSGDGHVSQKGGRPQNVEKFEPSTHFWQSNSRTMRQLLAEIVPKNFYVLMNDDSIMATSGLLPTSSMDWDVALGKAVYGAGGNQDVSISIDWNKSKVVLRTDLKKKAADLAAIKEAERVERESNQAKASTEQAKADVEISAADALSSVGVSADKQAADKAPVEFNVSTEDAFLSKTLERWCKSVPSECQQVKWMSPNEIVIEAEARHVGDTFADSVDNAFDSLRDSIPNKHLHHRLSPNGVLLVTE